MTIDLEPKEQNGVQQSFHALEVRGNDSNLGKSTTTLREKTFFASLGILTSRLSGLIRTPVLSAVFGATSALDSFYAAFRLPNALRELLADGALSTAFTKSLIQEQKENPEGIKSLLSEVSGVFLLITGMIYVFFFVFANPISNLLVGDGLGESGFQNVQTLLKILALYLPIMMLTSLATSYLTVKGMTFKATVASSLTNLGLIIGAVFFGPILNYFHLPSIYGLGYGLLFGGMLHLLVVALPIYQRQLLSLPSFWVPKYRHKEHLRSILSLLLPRSIGQGASTIALMINTFFASQLKVGSLTAITHAQIVVLVPVGLFGVASGFASLPVLTSFALSKNYKEFSDSIWDQTQRSMLLSLFSTFLLALFAVPICGALFSSGKSNMESAITTAFAVAAYGVGVVFNTGLKTIIQGLYALDKTKFTVIISFVYLIMNGTLSYLLWRPYGIVGLGLSNGIASSISFFGAIVHLAKYLEAQNTKLLTLNKSISLFAICALSFAIAGLGFFFCTHFQTVFETLFKRPLTGTSCVIFLCSLLCFGILSFFLFVPKRIKKALLTRIKK